MKSALRTALLALLVAGAASSAFAQASNKTARLAMLSGGPNIPGAPSLVGAFIEQLRLLGWDEGRNLTIDARHTDGRADLYALRASEIIASSPDVIFATNSEAIAAVKAQTSSIPIVMAGASHPVEAGFIQSLARPGSNVTGVTNQQKDLGGKHLEFLREIDPGIERVAVMFTPSNPGSVLGLQDLTILAQQVGISVIPIPFEGPSDLEVAALIMRQQRAQALQVHNTPAVFMNRSAIFKLAIESRLATISSDPRFARDGLLTYGTDQAENFRRAATYVDRILRGARPSDLPVEQPTVFRLHINLKTAQALGLTIPPTLLARADEVIE